MFGFGVVFLPRLPKSFPISVAPFHLFLNERCFVNSFSLAKGPCASEHLNLQDRKWKQPMLLECPELSQTWSEARLLLWPPVCAHNCTAAAGSDGFQGLSRASLPPTLSLLPQICPERIVSPRQPCLMLRRTSWRVQNGKPKAAGDSVSRSGIWLEPCELAVQRHGWTDCKHHPLPITGTIQCLKH